MSDSLPILVRSGVARMPLDPTDVVPGPQPIEPAEREGHHVIVGEVLGGRHRAPRKARRIAVSGALLSAAGAFVTLALMTSHGSAGTSAAPRAAPSTPMPDLPDEPAAAARPARAPAAPAVHTAAATVSHGGHPGSAAPAARTGATAWQREAAAAGELRQEATANAQAWAKAMRQEYQESGRWRAAGGRQGPAHSPGHGPGRRRDPAGR